MPKYQNIHEAINDNQRKDCSVRGCWNPRYRIGSLCKSCTHYRWYWGHPEARLIRPKEYREESDRVRYIIEKNLGHEGIQHGIKFLERYMERSDNGGTYLPCFRHAARLHKAGVEAKELLIELGAIYLLSRNFHTPIKDHRHLKYLLGNKFITFVPCRERIRGTENRDIGEFLNDNLGVLLINIVRTAQEMEKKAS